MRNLASAALVGFALFSLALVSPSAPADDDRADKLRASLNGVELGEEVLSVDVQESLFDPDGEFRVGSKDRAQLVDVVFRASPNLTNKMTGRGIEFAMVDAYVALFGAGVPIHQATVEAHMTLVDAYGNEALGAVYGTKLTGAEARKVKWSDPDAVRWERVWEVYLKNRAFK